MTDRKFNPIPTHAPEFRSNLAHFAEVRHSDSSVGKRKDRGKESSRRYIFKIGNSSKLYSFQDKYLDDKAMELLELCATNNERLVLKGYISPTYGATYFGVLTHFAVWKEDKPSFTIVNPDTGEVGSFYSLNTKLQDVNKDP